MSTTNTPSRFADKLRSKTVLILGGTSGVGFAAAAALVESGANVIISSSRESKLNSSLSSLRSSNPSINPNAITGFTCDLSSQEEVEQNLKSLFTSVSTHLNQTLHTSNLDHLIFTAGDQLVTIPVEEVTVSTFHSALQVRAISALLSVKTFLPLLPKSNTSSITLTSGSVSEKPMPGGWSMTAFIASGLNGMTRQLAFDLAPIRVNCVVPGAVDTELWSGMSEEQKKGMFEGIQKSLPTGRVASADDIAESYLYVLRDRNITGTSVHTNGGAFLG